MPIRYSLLAIRNPRGLHVLFLGSLLAVVLADHWSESSKAPKESAGRRGEVGS
jgi:hypothetical protein